MPQFLQDSVKKSLDEKAVPQALHINEFMEFKKKLLDFWTNVLIKSDSGFYSE